MHIIARIFRISHQGYSLRNIPLPVTLHKEIAIPLSLRVLEHIIHNRTRNSTLRIIIIHLCRVISAGISAKECQFRSQCLYISINACSSRVPCHTSVRVISPQMKAIFTRSISIFSTQSSRKIPIDFIIEIY